MSALGDQLRDDMKAAMRSKEVLRLSTIRLLIAAVKKQEIDTQTTLDDAAILKIIQKQVKQRQDSIAQFQAAGRSELAEKEQQELVILESYLPEQLSEAVLQAEIAKAIATTGATSVKDIGKIMTALQPIIEGKADKGLVSQLIKAALSS